MGKTKYANNTWVALRKFHTKDKFSNYIHNDNKNTTPTLSMGSIPWSQYIYSFSTHLHTSFVLTRGSTFISIKVEIFLSIKLLNASYFFICAITIDAAIQIFSNSDTNLPFRGLALCT